MKVLESKRLYIRPAEAHDFAGLLPLYNRKANMQYILEGRYRWTEADIRAKWHQLNQRLDDGYGLRIIIEKNTNRLLGEGGILLLERSRDQVPEIGFMLDIAERGKGLGQEVVSCLLEFAFHHLHLPRLRAGVRTDNAASLHLLKKNGFRHLYSISNASGKALDYLELHTSLS